MFSFRLSSFFALEFVLGGDFRARLGSFEINRVTGWETTASGRSLPYSLWFAEQLPIAESFELHLRFCRH